MKRIVFLLIVFQMHGTSAQSVKNSEPDSLLVLDSLFRVFYMPDAIHRTGNEFHVINWLDANDTTASFTLEDKRQQDALYRLLRLMRDNGIVAIKPAGIGDCQECSTYLFVNPSTAFVVLNPNHHCYSWSCYWPPKKARRKKVLEHLYLVRHLDGYRD